MFLPIRSLLVARKLYYEYLYIELTVSLENITWKIMQLDRIDRNCVETSFGYKCTNVKYIGRQSATSIHYF